MGLRPELCAAVALKKSGFTGSRASLNRFSLTLVVSALLLATLPAAGQKASELSADLPDSRVLRIQQKVEALFVADEFERALFIYINELAPIGDKYAQYMVGFMNETGLGTPKDPVGASAWYRLSAERGTPEFVQIRDKMMGALDEAERAESDAMYANLRRTYGDLAVLLTSIKRDKEQISAVTGTRLGGSSGAPVTIIDPHTGSTRVRTDYHRDVEKRMHERIAMLVELGGFDELGDDPTRVNVRELERLVNAKLETISN